MKQYVIAGHVSEYTTWLKRKKYSSNEFVYVGSIKHLQGVIEPHGFFIGSWYNRSDISEIITELSVRSFPNKELDKVLDIYGKIKTGTILV